MEYQLLNPFTVTFLCVTVVLWLLTVPALRHRERQGPRLLAAVLIAMSLWSIGDAIRFGAPGTESILLWERVRDTGIIFLAPTIFLFVAHYTGKHWLLDRRYVRSLYLVSAAFFVVAVTNPLHGLWASVEMVDPYPPPPVYVEGRGLLWYVFAIYGPALAAASYYLIFKKMAEETRGDIYRSQALLIGIGIFTPVLLTSFFLLHLVPFDPTPLGFGVSGVTFAIAIFRYDLLDVMPVARDAVVSTTTSGFLVIDSNDTIVDANEALSSIFEIPKAELIGTSLPTLRSDYPQLLDRVSDACDTTERISIRHGGENRHYDINVSPVRTAADTEAGRVIIFNDVTETVTRANELRERTAELERQNERLDQFASLVSHDLRNPLQIASSYTELAEETGEGKHYEAIHDAHDRMDVIIDELLTLSRAGRTIDEREPVAVGSVAAESWIYPDTEGVGFELAVPEDLSVRADRDRLRHLFENLYRNSVEHNETPLTVRVGVLDDEGVADGGATGFFIEDDGTGIPVAERDRVLEHGYTTSEEGTGLGLAIVTEVVDAHGWELDLSTGPDGGARFEIRTHAHL